MHKAIVIYSRKLPKKHYLLLDLALSSPIDSSRELMVPRIVTGGSSNSSSELAHLYSLSIKAVDIKIINLASRRILEQGGPVLTLALLDPVAVHSKCTSIDDL